MAYIGKRPQDTFPSNNAVTSTIIAENAVGSSEIATNAVDTLQIADNAVTGVKIAENGITSRELAANTIATGNIADNAIDSTKIAQNSILTKHIDDAQVTTDQLGADAVTAAKLADDAVVTANIVDANVTTVKIATNAVTSAKIAQNSILTKHIDDAQVGSDQLATDAVTTVKITDANVTAAKLASDSVTTAKITDANVTTVKIADTNITTAKIADDAVTLAKMAGLTRGSIIYGDSSGNPAALSLGSNGQVLTSDGTDISWGTDAVLSTENVQDIAGAMFSSNTETGISATYEDGDGTIDLVIGSNVITATMIAQNSILTRHIDDAQVTTAQLGADAVTGAKIADDAIDSEHFVDGSIDTAHIADDAVTAAKLADTAVTAASYGSSSAIPVLTIDAQGRITAASTAATSSTLTIAADSGSNDTVTVGTDTLTFEGTANEVDTTVSNNKITIGLPNNVTIAGNLTVAGTTTTVSSTTINVADPLISLATSNNSADAVDIGIYGLYDTSGSQDLYGGLFRDASDSGKWKLFKDNQAEPTTTVNTSGTGYAVGTLVANLEGNVTGNVTGNLTGTASAIANNSVTSASIVNGTIVSADIAANTIATGNIADNAIDSTKIAQNSILTKHIDDAQVTTDQLGADAVTAAKLADDAVVTANIVNANVTTAKLAADAVTGAKIADDAIDSEHYADGSIDTAHIADDQVTLAKMAGLARGKIIYGDSSGNPAALALGSNGQVLKSDGTDIAWAADSGLSTEEVQDIVGGMVTGNTETGIAVTYEDGDGTLDFVIGSGSIASSMLAADSVTQAKIADDAVGADQLAVNSVVSASIVNGSIVSADIAANTIATSNIADNAVDATKLASNSVLTRHIDDNQITGDQLADDLVLSGTGAIRVPDGTTGQRPGSPAAGMFRYNTTDSKFEGYTDSWGEIGGGGSNGFLTDIFDGTTTPATDGSRVAFTISQSVTDEKFLMVFIDGVYQAHDAYSVSGTTLTMADAPVAGRVLTVHSVSAAVQGDGLNVDNFSGDGSDTTFTLGLNPKHENNTQVYIDGVYQFKNTYSVSGTTLTFSTAPPNGSSIEVMTHSQTTVSEASSIAASAVSGLTQVTAVAADHLLLFDATDSALKKCLFSDALETATSISTSADAVALTFDSSENATFAGNIVKGNLTISGTEIDLSSGNLTLDVAGEIKLDSDDGIWRFQDNGGSMIELTIGSGSSPTFYSAVSDADIVFRGNDGGSAITSLTLDMSEAGQATFGGGIVSTAAANTLGATSFNEADLTNVGTIYADQYLGDADTDSGIVLPGSDVMTLHTNNAERMRITSTGNVGIGGNATPAQALEIYRNSSSGSAGNYAGLSLRNDDSSGYMALQFHEGATLRGDILIQNSVDDMQFRMTDGAERMRLTNAGTFLVGKTITNTNTDGFTCQPNDFMSYTNSSTDSGDRCLVLNRHGLNAGDLLSFRTQNSDRGIISFNGSVIVYGGTSDYRLKENVNYTWDATTKLKQLKPCEFNWISDSSDTKINGFIAHEVDSVVPQAVTGDKDGKDKHGNNAYQQLDPSQLVPLLVKTVQELEARIKTLEG